MSKIKRKDIDNSLESHLLTSLITNSDFCKQVIPLVNFDIFVNPYSKTIFKWVKDYYDQFGESPGTTIQEIYNVEKHKIDEEDSGLIETYLLKLSDNYEKGINKEYSVKQAEKYIQERGLIVASEKTLTLAKLGRLEEAEELWSGYKKIIRVTSDCVNPHSKEEIEKHFNREKEDYLIRFPGSLGEITGDLRRGWFVIVQGAYKAGKSFFLDAVKNLAIKNRLNVLSVDFEMTIEERKQRHYESITGQPQEAGTYLFPEWDCVLNQLGTCKKNEKTSSVPLYGRGDSVGSIKQVNGYKPCTYCRKKESLSADYKSAVYYKPIDKYGMTQNKVMKKSEAIQRVYGDCLRMKNYPRGSANVYDIEKQLDLLEYTSGWNCDVLIIDYLQIMGAQEKNTNNEEQKINDLSLALAGLSTKRNILVFTASQVKTSALNKSVLKVGDASQSSRAIYGHPALVLGISKGGDDNQEGIILANVIAHRFMTHNQNRVVKILQQLDVSRGIIDSEFMDIND